MARKDALRLRVVEVTGGAGLQTVKTEQVPPGEIWCIEQVAWEINKATSSGETRARLYIGGHGYNHYLEEQDNPTADALYTYAEVFYLHAGEFVVLELDHGAATTTVRMFLNGYKMEVAQNA